MKEADAIFRLLHEALLEMRVEAGQSGNQKAFHLADLFHNVPLQLARVHRGELTHKQVLEWVKARAKEKGMTSWLNGAGKYAPPKATSSRA